MEKVILITSREIPKPTNSSIKLKIINYDSEGDNSNWENNYLVQFPKFWTSRISAISDKETQEFIEQIQKATKLEDAEKIAKEVVSKIRSKHKNENYPFHIGIFNREEGDTFVFWAEEYPFGGNGFTEDRQRYLNALIFEIKEHICEKGKTNLMWEIVSHEKDWGYDKPNKMLEKKDREILINTISQQYSTLSEIVNKEDTIIRLFQHIPSDDTYLYAQHLINGPGASSFDDFIDKGLSQKKDFTDYLRDPNEMNWKKLMCIDPTYPFMPFDLVENPLT